MCFVSAPVELPPRKTVDGSIYIYSPAVEFVPEQRKPGEFNLTPLGQLPIFFRVPFAAFSFCASACTAQLWRDQDLRSLAARSGTSLRNLTAMPYGSLG